MSSFRKNMESILNEMAKYDIKNNNKLKSVLEDLKSHKKDGFKWALQWNYYFNISNVSLPQVFNRILENKGFEPFYNKNEKNFMIRLKRKNK
jgi:hypothetical protein